MTLHPKINNRFLMTHLVFSVAIYSKDGLQLGAWLFFFVVNLFEGEVIMTCGQDLLFSIFEKRIQFLAAAATTAAATASNNSSNNSSSSNNKSPMYRFGEIWAKVPC